MIGLLSRNMAMENSSIWILAAGKDGVRAFVHEIRQAQERENALVSSRFIFVQPLLSLTPRDANWQVAA